MGFHKDAPEFLQLVNDAPPLLVAGWVTGSVIMGVTLILFGIQLHQHSEVESWKFMSVVEGSDDDNALNRKIRHKRNSIKILCMVPVFSVCACLSLFFLNFAVPLELIMSVYEAIALYSFLRLLVDLMGGRSKCPEVLSKEPPAKYLAVPPCFCCVPCCCPKITITNKWYILIEVGVLQYLIVKPVCTTLSLILFFTGNYEIGDMDWSKSYPYIRLVEVASVLIAAYFLFVIWKASKVILKKYNTGLKFLGIKVVILVSVIQGFLLSMLIDKDVIRDDYVLHADTIAEMWASWMLVVEMFLICLLFFKAFPVSDYYTPVDESFSLLSDSRAKATPSSSSSSSLSTPAQRNAYFDA